MKYAGVHLGASNNNRVLAVELQLIILFRTISQNYFFSHNKLLLV